MALESRGAEMPFPSMSLYPLLVNTWRKMTPPDTGNFRKSAKLLVKNGYLELYRDSQSLQMAFKLTDKGREQAMKCLDKRNEESKKAMQKQEDDVTQARG